MSFELPTSNSEGRNDTSREAPLDDRWYDRFKDVAAFQDYDYLNGYEEHREEQRQQFLAGNIENPTLDYPDLGAFPFDEKESALLQLKQDILAHENNEVVRQLYRWRINEKLAELRMLRAATDGDSRRFFRYSKFIYGNPSGDIHHYTLSRMRQVIGESIASTDAEKQESAKRVWEQLFSSQPSTTQSLEIPNIPAPEITSEEQEFSADDIKAAFENALERYKVEGFKVEIDETGKKTSVNVNQEEKTVYIPADRKMKTRDLQALIEHEIGTHARRRSSGERSKLMLLGLGLDRYLRGEEGVATYEEQKVSGAQDFAGFDGHIAISLATGIDGKKRNFREVFSILKDLYIVQSKKSGPDAVHEAEKKAYNRCVRTFRGTDCQTPGACLTKDIVYREGNIETWNVVRSNPQEERRFMVGKYDPSNPRHIWILDQLGISDADLATIDME